MPINFFHGIINDLSRQSSNSSFSGGSDIMMGTVMSVDPLSIQLQSGDILPSKSFYLSDNVIVKKVRFIVHRMYGQPKTIVFTGSANELSNNTNMLLFNLTGDASGESDEDKKYAVDFSMNVSDSKLEPYNPFNLDISGAQRIPFDTGTFNAAILGDEIGVSGPVFDTTIDISGSVQGVVANASLKLKDTVNDSLTIRNMDVAKTMDLLNHVFKINENVNFKLEFTEEDGNTPELNNPHQNQTTALEGILWNGIENDDIVLLTSHNGKQKYLVHRILNRKREPEFYNQVIQWDSRLNDVEGTVDIRRH